MTMPTAAAAAAAPTINTASIPAATGMLVPERRVTIPTEAEQENVVTRRLADLARFHGEAAVIAALMRGARHQRRGGRCWR